MIGHARIALVANNFPPVHGGSAVVYGNLARHAGGEVVVVAPSRSYLDGLPLIGWREHDRRASFKVVRLPLLRTELQESSRAGPRRFWFFAADVAIRARLAAVLLWLILRCGVRTVCIGELLASGWLIALLRLIPVVRTVAYVHGEEITTEDSYDPGHRRARRALKAVDRIVVVSRFTEAAVRRLLGNGCETKVRLIENGVDTERFRCAGPKRADLLQLYGLGNDFVFVSVCRLLEKKGLDNAIRAFAHVSAAFPEARYLIVGTGPYADRLSAIARECSVAERVVFAGQVPEDDLVAHYCLGDVFVMPNRELPNGDTEGFGLVFLEANSCGIPVIAGQAGGSTDAVTDSVNGLVVDGTSTILIAAAMRKLVADATLRRALSLRGVKTAAMADWKRKASAFVETCAGAARAG